MFGTTRCGRKRLTVYLYEFRIPFPVAVDAWQHRPHSISNDGAYGIQGTLDSVID